MVVKNLAVSANIHTPLVAASLTLSLSPSFPSFLPPSLSSSQIADQVGELLIHCRYGCKQREEDAEEYDVDPEGELVM